MSRAAFAALLVLSCGGCVTDEFFVRARADEIAHLKTQARSRTGCTEDEMTLTDLPDVHHNIGDFTVLCGGAVFFCSYDTYHSLIRSCHERQPGMRSGG